MLTALAPGNLSKVLLATGGSDAIEIALAYARAATGRFKTLSFWDAYHGAGFGARSIGGEAMFRSGPIGPLLPGSEHVPPFGDYRNAWGVTQNSADFCLSQIRYVLEKEGDICALIAEPMRATNPVLAPPGFWQQVKAACHHHGALLIFDEIPTGLGRTGKLFACAHEQVVPDILVLGKALGGGVLPIAATLCHPDLDVCGDYAYGHYTHEKNPVTTRAALTTLQILQEEGLVDNARSVGELALQRLRDMMNRHPLILNHLGQEQSQLPRLPCRRPQANHLSHLCTGDRSLENGITASDISRLTGERPGLSLILTRRKPFRVGGVTWDFVYRYNFIDYYN